MQKPLISSKEKAPLIGTPDVLTFVGVLLIATGITTALYLIPIEVLVIGAGISFIPFALFVICRH